jgi:cell division protein FtsL
VNITKLNYRIAKEIRVRNELLEDSRRLKVEMATLKSPHRIEKIAKEKLKMDYPLRGQVVYLK